MSTRIPKYRLHKGSGQALVQINGERIYLGKHGSAESKEKYQRIIAEWLVSVGEPKQGDVASPATTIRHDLPINEMLLAYLKFAEGYYAKDGEATKEFVCMKHSLRSVGPPTFVVYAHALRHNREQQTTLRKQRVKRSDLLQCCGKWTRIATLARNPSAVRASRPRSGYTLGTDDGEMTAALKTINLEDDWIARLAHSVNLRLCTAGVWWPTRSWLTAWLLVGRWT